MTENIRIYTDEELAIRNDGLIKIKHGLDILGINFFLMMGVLLGAIRDKDFIKWDWDVELGLLTDSIINRVDELKEIFNKGLFKVEVVDTTYEGFKINLFYHGNKFTLWGLHEKGSWMQRKSYKFPKEYFSEFDEINFRGESYKIPINGEKLLSHIYGDWKTPIISMEKDKYLKDRIFNKKSLIKRIIKKISN